MMRLLRHLSTARPEQVCRRYGGVCYSIWIQWGLFCLWLFEFSLEFDAVHLDWLIDVWLIGWLVSWLIDWLSGLLAD
jgi:hypothetical protein